MSNDELAAAYLKKASLRLEILPEYIKKEGYSDAIREAQEIVELATKAMLRMIGIDPPKWHDVSALIAEHSTRFPETVQERIADLVKLSQRLRKEREIAMYGDIDMIPTELYSRSDAEQALADAALAVALSRATAAAP
jgi:HEPN domain-containing protein